MTWIEALVKIIGILAWPLTIAVLILVFRYELNLVLKNITKLEFPGGSIEVKLDKIQTGLPTPETGQSQAFSAAEFLETSLIQSGNDPRIALARTWFTLEQELFRPSELGLSPSIEASRTTSRRIDDLVEAGLLDNVTADKTRDFLKLAKEIAHTTRNYSEQEMGRALEIGARLVTDVRRRIVGAELLHHFHHNILWQHAQRPRTPGDIRSVVAASAPDFEYDYDLYDKTIETFNHEEAARAAEGNFDAVVMDPLTLSDFVLVLEFREREIMRVLKEKRKPREEWERDNLEWMWPQKWGDIGWNGPVLRDDRSAAFDLEKLRRALEKYRQTLKVSGS